MFKAGDTCKVKVELPDKQIGFGRATVVDTEGNRIYITLSTHPAFMRKLPVGSQLWMVSETAENRFNGLWVSTVVGEKHIAGRTVLECNSPKFTSIPQRRKYPRVPISCPVWVIWEGKTGAVAEATCIDISKSGIGIEAEHGALAEIQAGSTVHINIHSHVGNIAIICTVIRNVHNWLTDSNQLGLQFVELNPTDKEILKRLLDSLCSPVQIEGNAPVFSGQEYPDEDEAPKGLAGWLKGKKSDTSFFHPKETTDAQSEDAKPAESTPGDQPGTPPSSNVSKLRKMQSK